MGCGHDNQCESQDLLIGFEPPMEIIKPNQTITKDGGEAVFEVTNYDSWFIMNVTTQHGDRSPEIIFNKPASNNHIENEWFTINIPDDEQNKLYCTVKQNHTNDKRSITISMSVGDAFDKLIVTQE